MKSQKGITMTSLIIYIASFLVITGIIGAITTYFYNNIEIMDKNSGSAAEYNKLNVYMLKQIKTEGVTVEKYGNEVKKDSSRTENEIEIDIAVNGIDIDGVAPKDDISFITFKLPNGNKNSFIKVDDKIYFNKILLCENVKDFKIKVTKDIKTIIEILVQISDKQYSTKYVLE